MFFLLHVGCIWQYESKQIHQFPTKTSNHFKNFQEILEPHLALGCAHTAPCFFFGLRISSTSVSSNFGFRRPPVNLETKATMGKCWSMWIWLNFISWKFHPAGKNNRSTKVSPRSNGHQFLPSSFCTEEIQARGPWKAKRSTTSFLRSCEE